ncbi:MAG: zinc-binding dehydrogenase [Firmicutes bacterium]|nr:zinc-binding dehydrogenase [Bacillota bacterium]
MVLEEFNKPLVLRDFEIPHPKPGQLLVRMLAAGVCGSDLHMYQGEDPRTPLPLILGHEGVGRIEAIGDEAVSVCGRRLQTGDVVLWNRGVSCGRCWYCQILKQPALCTQRQVYGINLGLNDPPGLNGCYSEYILLRERTDLFYVPPGVDPAALVSAACSGATVAHGYELAPVGPEDTVVVQGPGPLGIWAAAMARVLGAGQVIVIGGSPERLELCKRFGATGVLNRRETSVGERQQEIMALTDGRGADLVVEATGHQSAFIEGVELLRRGGTYLCTGYAQPVGTADLDPYRHLVGRGVKIQGVWVSDTAHVRQALALALRNPEHFAQMVTLRLPLERANEALAAVAAKQALKVILEVGA